MTAQTESLPLLILRVREHFLACVRPILQDNGLTEPQWRVLRVLQDSGELSAQALAHESAILSPSLSRILARLEIDGLVLRRASSADQRSITVRLSAKGKRLCKRLAPKLEAQYRRLTDRVGADALNRLGKTLEEVNTAASES